MPASGARNMAVDEAILESAGQGLVLPTLRLYAWQPACLSLGYAQSAGDVDFSALQTNGWDLVRRPTGGRAILHSDELTYSVCGPVNERRLSGSLLESYQMLSTALLRALELLAIPAQAMKKGSATTQQKAPNPVCFEVPSNYEITINGKKLIGSAQARRKEGILQHGSLPLKGDLSRIVQALAFPDPEQRRQAAERLLQRAATAEQALGTPPTWKQAAQAFANAFAEILNLEWVETPLTPSEHARAQRLYLEKYSNPKWTKKI